MATEKPNIIQIMNCLRELRDIVSTLAPDAAKARLTVATQEVERIFDGFEREVHRLGCLLSDHEVTHWPRVRDLPEAERELFRKVLNGQTCPMINGLPFDQQDAYYPWDYERWKAGKPVVD